MDKIEHAQSRTDLTASEQIRLQIVLKMMDIAPNILLDPACAPRMETVDAFERLVKKEKWSGKP